MELCLHAETRRHVLVTTGDDRLILFPILHNPEIPPNKVLLAAARSRARRGTHRHKTIITLDDSALAMITEY